jgi:integrase
MAYSDEELLTELRQQAGDDGIAPSCSEINESEAAAALTYRQNFGSWWKSVVRAGLTPRERTPLTKEQWKQFHDAAVSLEKPSWKLSALFTMFTGLTPRLSEKLSESWIDERNRDTLIRVPQSETQSGDRWTFRLPEMWTHNGDEIRTELPGLLSWYISNRDFPPLSESMCKKIIWKTAVDANLTGRRQVYRDLELDVEQPIPLVRASDLRATGGVRMARNDAPTRRIRRHLGIKHTNWQANVEDFFLWCQVHVDDFSHPDWEPVQPVLDPVD